MNYSQILEKLINKISLNDTEAYDLMAQILAGNFSNEKISGLLIAMRCKGETTNEVLGFVKAMREVALKLDTDLPVVDTCGTGGDGAHTFNISTTAAFIAAGAGVTIAKHHNRSVSSRCGSADVLEALGIDIQMPPDRVKAAVEKIGIGFCFAPHYHPSMKHAAQPRRELGVRTIFNMLGPLLNPFSARRQVIGVYNPNLTEFFAEILHQLGSQHVFILHGEDGLDEFTVCGKTRITELINGTVQTQTVAPEDFGLCRATRSDLVGGDVIENARILTDLLSGQSGPKRDAAVLNASLAIVCAGNAKSIPEGIAMANASIDSRRAMDKLRQLIDFGNGGN